MIKLPDVTLVYVIVAFAIAYAILKRSLFQPLGAILDERDAEEREASRLHAESVERMRAAIASAEQALSLARREALTTREALRDEGRSRLDARLAEAGASASASVARAASDLERQTSQLSRELPEKSRTLAVALAEKILGRKFAA